ncbi:hypothetical protein N8500_06160 [Candidatus Puniceispirillum sp.]|nr:hypothetical protein [Candidatus Puniceispirillum sp.]
MPKIRLNSLINVDHIRSDSLNFFKFSANDCECQLLAARFHFIDVKAFSAEFSVNKSARNCWDVNGQLRGHVVQACGVTGVPLRETVDFKIKERYVRVVSSLNEVEVLIDEAEPLENGAINIGEMLAQSLAVAVTPWPRAVEAPETFTSGEKLPDHPFAGLAAFKRQTLK